MNTKTLSRIGLSALAIAAIALQAESAFAYSGHVCYYQWACSVFGCEWVYVCR